MQDQSPTKTKLYISHGAGHSSEKPDWFIVRPNPLGLENEIQSLLTARRTVLVLDVPGFLGEKITLTLNEKNKPARGKE